MCGLSLRGDFAWEFEEYISSCPFPRSRFVCMGHGAARISGRTLPVSICTELALATLSMMSSGCGSRLSSRADSILLEKMKQIDYRP